MTRKYAGNDFKKRRVFSQWRVRGWVSSFLTALQHWSHLIMHRTIRL